ncbi:MAG: GNAT family N-acetyltransferase [Myxococcota bacterium]
MASFDGHAPGIMADAGGLRLASARQTRMQIAQPNAARLVFRELAEHNLELFHELVCDEHIRRFLLDGQSMSLGWCAQILESTSEEKARSGLGMWLLYERGDVKPFGFGGYLRFADPDSPLQLVYALRASHTGRGYGREAAVALIDFAREHCAQGDIVAGVDEPNVASSKLLECLGFQCTGSVPGAFGHMLQYRLTRGRPPLERRTQRLILRPFRESDRDSFARLNADARVMQHFPSTLTRSESDALIDAVRQHFETRGFGPWAIELLHDDGCIGAAGLAVPSFDSHFTPCVEIAWRLAAEHWGRGYAQEAARAALHTAFVHLELKQVVSFTPTSNERSCRVMQRLGMHRDPNEDFDHPRVPPGHPLRRHVLYRLDAATWRAGLQES